MSFKRKNDKLYNFSSPDKVIVQYQEGDCQLYLVDNPDKINLTFGDYIAVTSTNEESSKRMPYAICKVVAFTGEEFEDIANFLGITLESEYAPRYHEEKVVKNITRDEGSGNGGQASSSDGVSSSEKGMGAKNSCNSDGSPNQNDENSASSQESSSNSDSRQESPTPQQKTGTGYNQSSEVWKNIPTPKKESKKTVDELLKEGKIFKFVKKHH